MLDFLRSLYFRSGLVVAWLTLMGVVLLVVWAWS